ncbi:MAG: hypothetical protein LBS92_02230 [Candidatus Methanoplasma sp.]|jgi:hypothetical protein|nr:hypothetical protein [Candidatus Methanoplasma sp.]
MIKEWPPEDVGDYLDGFVCTRDPDLELFLRNKAVVFEKRDLSRTFLLVDDDKIVGYMSLSITILEIKEDWPVSNQLKRSMNVSNNAPTVAFLIGQLCKADGVSDKIGPDMIDLAMKMFDGMRKVGGGRVVCVDCKEGLLGFYNKNGFRVVSKPTEDGLYRMVRLF